MKLTSLCPNLIGCEDYIYLQAMMEIQVGQLMATLTQLTLLVLHALTLLMPVTILSIGM